VLIRVSLGRSFLVCVEVLLRIGVVGLYGVCISSWFQQMSGVLKGHRADRGSMRLQGSGLLRDVYSPSSSGVRFRSIRWKAKRPCSGIKQAAKSKGEWVVIVRGPRLRALAMPDSGIRSGLF